MVVNDSKKGNMGKWKIQRWKIGKDKRLVCLMMRTLIGNLFERKLNDKKHSDNKLLLHIIKNRRKN
nr:hypothetical protein MACL_00000300 [Theileria orientalis]